MDQPKKRTQKRRKKTANTDKAKPSKRKQSQKHKQLYCQTIFRDWCKACGICSAFCPKNVIGRDESGAPVIERPDQCIGCRFCELHCPDFAITIKESRTERSENLS